MGVDADGDTEGSRQSEVGDFDGAGLVDEEVLWLQISVKDTSLVTEQDGLRIKRQQLYNFALSNTNTAYLSFTKMFQSILCLILGNKICKS